MERAMINEGEGGAPVEEWVELANGCVCCTVKHSLVQALEQLVQRKERLGLLILSCFLFFAYLDVINEFKVGVFSAPKLSLLLVKESK